MVDRTFTTFDIRDKMKIKIERLKDWLTRGYIEPSLQKASGHGTKNIFNRTDLYLIGLFQYLTNQKGFSRDVAASKIKLIKRLHQIALGYEKIKKTKLSYKGLAEIKRKFERLDQIEYLMFYLVDDPIGTSAVFNLPAIVDVMMPEKDDRSNILKIDMDKYKGCDEIFIINFRKIRERIDSVID